MIVRHFTDSNAHTRKGTTIIFKIQYISCNSGSTLNMELLRIPETPAIRIHGCISRQYQNITSELV